MIPNYSREKFPEAVAWPQDVKLRIEGKEAIPDPIDVAFQNRFDIHVVGGDSRGPVCVANLQLTTNLERISCGADVATCEVQQPLHLQMLISPLNSTNWES